MADPGVEIDIVAGAHIRCQRCGFDTAGAGKHIHQLTGRMRVWLHPVAAEGFGIIGFHPWPKRRAACAGLVQPFHRIRLLLHLTKIGFS